MQEYREIWMKEYKDAKIKEIWIKEYKDARIKEIWIKEYKDARIKGDRNERMIQDERMQVMKRRYKDIYVITVGSALASVLTLFPLLLSVAGYHQFLITYYWLHKYYTDSDIKILQFGNKDSTVGKRKDSTVGKQRFCSWET